MRATSPLDQCIVQQLANGRYHRQDTRPLYFAESDPTHPRCTLVLVRSPYAGAKYAPSFADNSKSRISTQLLGDEAPTGADKT